MITMRPPSVAVLRRAVSTARYTGVDVYANSIEKVLEERLMETHRIEMVLDMKNGALACLLDGFIRPFFRTMRLRNKAEIFHATDDLCCSFFPFIGGHSRKIVTFHHVVSKKDKDVKYRWLWKTIAKIGIIWADDIIAISPNTKEEMIKNYNIREERITVIFNKISDIFQTLNIPKKEFIGCVSTLMPRKNMTSLIRAFKIFTEMPGTEGYMLRICGKGPEKDKLISLASDLSIENRIEFLQDLTDEEIVIFYNEAMIMANPSMHEGFGNMTLESQRCSTPVVFFNGADIPKEVTKFAVGSEDEHDFAMKMYGLITDQERYEIIVRKGKDHADMFSESFDEDVISIYSKKD